MTAEYLTADQVAERLGLSAWTVLEMGRKGVIPSVRLSRKTVRFAWDQVVAALRERQEPIRPGAVLAA